MLNSLDAPTFASTVPPVMSHTLQDIADRLLALQTEAERTMQRDGFCDQRQFFVNYVARWLDTARPGWAAMIDIERLNLAHCVNCILGQVFHDTQRWVGVSGYHIGMNVIMYTDDDKLQFAVALGVFASTIYHANWLTAIHDRLQLAKVA